MIVQNQKEFTNETVQFFYGAVEPYSIYEPNFLEIVKPVIENIFDNFKYEMMTDEVIFEILLAINQYLSQCDELQHFRINLKQPFMHIDLCLKDDYKVYELTCQFGW